MKKFNETSGSEKGCFGCLTVIVAIITFCFFYIADHTSDPNEKTGMFSMDIIIPLMNHERQAYAFANANFDNLPDYIKKTMIEYAPLSSDYYNQKIFDKEHAFTRKLAIKDDFYFLTPFLFTRQCVSMAFYLDSEKTLKSKLKSLSQEELETFKLTHESKFIRDKFVLLAKLAYKDKNYELATTYFNCWGLWHMTPQQYNEGKIPSDVFNDMGKERFSLFDE